MEEDILRKDLDKSITVFWFLMDLSWMCESKIASAFFVYVMMLASIDFILSKFSSYSLVGFLWILANGLWMLSDLYEIQTLLAAQIVSGIGVCLMLWMWQTGKDFPIRFRFWK